jgi:signal transduction histidine kinase
MEATKKTLSVDPSRAGVELEKAQQVTREGLQELKRTIKALRPEIMENRSFVDAIRLLAEESRLAGSIDIQLQLNLDVEDGPDSLTEVSLFRVIQETITNAIRHGQATRVDVKLTQAGTRMVLEMTDNGRGTLHIRKGFGLTGIQERIERLGGSVMFSSKPGSGFTTQIQIPWLKGERL